MWCNPFASPFAVSFAVCVHRRCVVWPLNLCAFNNIAGGLLSGKHWFRSVSLFFNVSCCLGFLHNFHDKESPKIWQICCCCYCRCFGYIAWNMRVWDAMCKDEHWKCNPLKSTNPFRLVVCVHVYVRSSEYITSIAVCAVCARTHCTQFETKLGNCVLAWASTFIRRTNKREWWENERAHNETIIIITIMFKGRHAYIGVNAPNWTYFMPYVRGKCFVTMRDHNRHIAARESQPTASDVCTKYRLECISVHDVVASQTRFECLKSFAVSFELDNFTPCHFCCLFLLHFLWCV